MSSRENLSFSVFSPYFRKITMSYNTSSNATSEPQPSYRCSARPFINIEVWFQVSAFVIIMVGSIIGNVLVITVIKKNRRMHIQTNYFLVSLCFLNLLIISVDTVSDVQVRITPQLGFIITSNYYCILILILVNEASIWRENINGYFSTDSIGCFRDADSFPRAKLEGKL